jgi:hypothetical protein
VRDDLARGTAPFAFTIGALPFAVSPGTIGPPPRGGVVVRLEGEVMTKLSESRVGDGVSGPSRNRVYRFYPRVYKLYANQDPSV